MNVVEFKPETNFAPTVLASPANTNDSKQLTKQKSELHETDLNLFLFNNKSRLEKSAKKPFYSEYPTYKTFLKLRKKVWFHLV